MRWGFNFTSVHIDVEMRTMEKGSLRYFPDTGAGFNEKQSKLSSLLTRPTIRITKLIYP